MDTIHPAAIIDPSAKIAPDVEVGAYAIIGAGTELAPGCRVAPHAQIHGRVEIGAGTTIGHGTVIGTNPQDLSFDPATRSGVRIGAGNTIREHVTIHRSASADGWTSVGDGNFLMAGTHLGHDVQMGDRNIVANNCLLAGHVIIGSATFLGGGSVFHQFIHLGDLCLTQGNSTISKDIPPYCIASQLNQLAGLNVIGMRRADIAADTRSALRRAYRGVFSASKPMRTTVAELLATSLLPEVEKFLRALVSTSGRGVCFPR